MIQIHMDFVGPLPEEHGFDTILTITDHLGADVWLIPCRKDMTAKQLAELFFQHWYCKNGLPGDIISDRDKLFLSQFWKHLHELMDVDLKMSMAFHPETDGSSEHTNKTVNWTLHFYVDHNQHGWVSALPQVHFAMMNTVNASTRYSGFQLHLGCVPQVIPPIIRELNDASETPVQFLEQINTDVADA